MVQDDQVDSHRDAARDQKGDRHDPALGARGEDGDVSGFGTAHRNALGAEVGVTLGLGRRGVGGATRPVWIGAQLSSRSFSSWTPATSCEYRGASHRARIV